MSENPQDDPEVKALLEKLGNKNPLPGPEVPPNQQPLNELDPEKVKVAQEEELKKKGKKGQSVTKAKPADVALTEDDATKDLSDKYKGIIRQYSDVAGVMLKDLNNDRKRILRAVKACRDVVESGGKVPRAYIEGWIAALATLSDTNGHKVKLLDSFAKFMAAGKNSEIFNNLSVNLDTETLTKLLETTAYPDENR
jgi:hypothetical protein